MAVQIVQVTGANSTALELTAVGLRGEELRPVWPVIFQMMEEATREQFESHGARGGNLWPELSDGWLWQKFQRGDNLAIMRATDETHGSIASENSSSVREEGHDWIEFGSTTPQFSIHQDYNPSSNFPERKPVVFTEVDANEYANIMMEYITGSTDARGITRRRYPAGTPGGLGGRFV